MKICCDLVCFYLQKRKGPPGPRGPLGHDGPIVSRQKCYYFKKQRLSGFNLYHHNRKHRGIVEELLWLILFSRGHLELLANKDEKEFKGK